MKTLSALFASVGLLLTPVLHASIMDGPFLNPATGHYYYLLSPDTWTASEAAAVSMGGHLVTINDDAEETWVWNTFSSLHTNLDFWIGLNDFPNQGSFHWSSGDSSSYRHWAQMEPNQQPNEYYVGIFQAGDPQRAGFWNDFQNEGDVNILGVQISGIVELVPEPGTAALATLAVSLLWFRPGKRL